jgi:hypothetical protein
VASLHETWLGGARALGWTLPLVCPVTLRVPLAPHMAEVLGVTQVGPVDLDVGHPLGTLTLSPEAGSV